ncbi:LysR family transcriptional regulator [Pokkaliibacter sp. MBI-7]|uniref:LysR family transcriptional regulator n=1 Tax=Pokkaliibacter sp. MBI-7 TaxID=3040600 RepID=UPI00244CE868|nr:LysR family transcriptional regulator [Pokkaliibacter sp. MBI-7]MDH2434426.1 LysR family transcriptional regulator [Pokkaliibacter sp. MBI-7]
MNKASQLQDTAMRYFLEVARTGSISEASTRLNVAPSAISRQIASLEDLLGTVLFERRPRGMVLSAAGELLAAHARKTALESDRVVAEIKALEGLHRGHVRVSCSEGFAMEFLPFSIADFRREHEGIHFHINVSAPAEVSRRVRHGDADIGITFSLTPAKDIHVAYRQPSPIYAVLHPQHPLARRKTVSLAQLQPYPIAVPEQDTTVRQLFDICCSNQRLLFEPALVSNYMAALNRFSAFDGGVSLAGEISMRHMIASGQVCAVRIRDRGMDVRNIEVQTLSGRTLPHAVKAFLEYLITHMPGKEDEGS